MYLNNVTIDGVQSVACYEHDRRTFKLGFPRPIVDDIFNRQKGMESGSMNATPNQLSSL